MKVEIWKIVDICDESGYLTIRIDTCKQLKFKYFSKLNINIDKIELINGCIELESVTIPFKRAYISLLIEHKESEVLPSIYPNVRELQIEDNKLIAITTYGKYEVGEVSEGEVKILESGKHLL